MENRTDQICLKTVYTICYAVILLLSALLLLQLIVDVGHGLDRNDLVVHGVFLLYTITATVLFRWGILEMKRGVFIRNPYHFSCLLLMLLVGIFVLFLEIMLHAPPVGHG